MSTKIPYLFYFEDAIGSWAPATEEMEQAFLQTFPALKEAEDGERYDLCFRVSYMTEEEFNSLPEA